MPENSGLLQLIKYHLRLHRDVEIQDIYKMLYQGVFGGEHLLTTRDAAQMRLDEEWRRVSADGEQDLFEPVSIDGRVVRINLRRCKADGIDLAEIWRAFHASGGKVNASLEDFEGTWRRFHGLCSKRLLMFPADKVAAFGREAKNFGCPAKHHSSAYRQANEPAYRVLLKNELNFL